MALKPIIHITISYIYISYTHDYSLNFRFIYFICFIRFTWMAINFSRSVSHFVRHFILTLFLCLCCSMSNVESIKKIRLLWMLSNYARFFNQFFFSISYLTWFVLFIDDVVLHRRFVDYDCMNLTENWKRQQKKKSMRSHFFFKHIAYRTSSNWFVCGFGFSHRSSTNEMKWNIY